MSKTSSRIPTFRSKPPQLKPKPLEITPKDIGKKVRVVEKEGTLRYVGNVHFSTGVWCGVELSSSLGKNDGVVNGVRYFACPQSCGLMAPLSKVSLLEGHDNIEDGISGPYSMLFINQKDETYKADSTEEDILNQTVIEVSQDNRFKSKNDLNGETEAELENHKSCENLFTELAVEVKRRRTATKIDNAVLHSIEKPSSLPQLRTNQSFGSFEFGSAALAALSKFSHSTPVRGEFEESLLRKLQLTTTSTIDDDGSKRDSLEFEESLGILTPEQMVDGMSFMSVINSRTPSSECIGEIKEKADLPSPGTNPGAKTELPSPNLVDASVTDFSLGIIDEQLISNLTLKTDTTMNMELPLDTIDKSKDFTLTRLEQTPSPEDLPLDPTPIVESDPKTEPSKSKTSNSFITSITSITSLDTGYQGDGEMSRPASRGADNSPLTRRPLPRPQTRRPDPMTDSDFYTESDADNHEENPLRGDRRAQVIDGTLYGVDPQAAADIYVNNRENMDSSGIFTDIESNTRNEEDPRDASNLATDVSPSDTSSKTISGNSQNNIQEILEKAAANVEDKEQTKIQKENPKKRNAPSPVVSSPSVRSPRHAKEENVSKKFKLPKREVPSKVKAMLESSPQGEKKISTKKTVGRWDAVMNKISKTEQKTNLKEVKSKVFSSVNVGNVQRQNEVRKVGPRQAASQKSPNTKRRVRARTGSATTKNNVESSIHSSFSDISASGTPPKTTVGSSKKREVVQVTQVLTASKLSPRPAQQNATDSKKTTPTSSISESKPKRIPSVLKDKKQPSKECGRATVKGGRTSPVVRPPVHPRAPAKPVPKVAEALAVLVQHLVFNVEAYQVPVLKKQVQKLRNETDEFRATCQHLEDTLAEERTNGRKLIEEERVRCASEISELVEQHRNQIVELNSKQYEVELRLHEENEANKQMLAKQNEEKLLTLKVEFQKLQKTHEESLDILREENDAIREQIDEKSAQIEDAKHESRKLKDDYEAKEMKLKEQLQSARCENQKLKHELSKLEEKFQEKLDAAQEEIARLRDDNDRLLSYSNIKDKGISIQELQSLRVVLELKQNEVGELRRALAEANQKNETLAAAEEKSASMSARCEDLQLQLQRKSELEQSLIAENKKLYENFKEEINQNKRLCQHNEELKWKLKQNKEVVSKVLEQAAEESHFSRSFLSSSFNERHLSSNKQSLERALSFREKNSDRSWKSDLSPPSSPKVKGVVEKSDSVSYVLDLDESPDVVASRIVRRSFRNSTPPKTTPTKSPSNKRPRMKFPLSLSASASAILPSNSSRSRNGEFDGESAWVTSTPKRQDDDLDLDLDEDDLKLPALPSEMGRKNGAQALPSPKHLAGEAMISESNSEDESTSSSSVQL
ncbi:centrosomal protein of 164 kDa isoform X2 [Zophobas morio]|uniref:centrosomal protein of 164 kDa isoform X2 n=1 Tax=Zophobas morio TaxID=2755281 RepID=UPI0030829870